MGKMSNSSITHGPANGLFAKDRAVESESEILVEASPYQNWLFNNHATAMADVNGGAYRIGFVSRHDHLLFANALIAKSISSGVWQADI